MKKIVLSLALVSASFAFAQKKEIQNASKAIEKNDIAAAKAEISKAEGFRGILLRERSFIDKRRKNERRSSSFRENHRFKNDLHRERQR